MATIKDVAKEAKVGLGTVSRYLNGIRIKEENRVRIEEAIQKLHFKINPIARCLKTNKTKTIGVIIPDLSDVFSTTIVKNIEHLLYSQGYNIFACDTWGSLELERRKVQILRDKLVDGMIVYPCSHNVAHLLEVQAQGIPVVTIDMGMKDFECDQVLTDNTNATYTAAEWLIGSGHKRIGFISGPEDSFTARERLNGYKRALEDFCIHTDERLIRILAFDEKSGYMGMHELMALENPPTAVIASNYYTTLGAVKAIYKLGIKVPEKLSFIGFDNLGLSEIVQPPLSIIVQPMEEIGRKAAELLLSRIHNDYSGFPSVLRLKTELILRESTKPAG